MEEAAPLYRFGPFELDPTRFELRRDGEPLAVQPKVLDLVLYLVRHRDRVVPRDEILDALWPDATVTEASLAKAVRSARRVLDDDARAPRRIQTIRRRGLRFVEAVAELPGEEPKEAGADDYFGRERALAVLRDALESARRGEGMLVLLEGEAGMGKTRTAREAMRLARGLGARAAFGWCPEREPTPAFFPVVTLARAWLDSASDADRAGLARELGSGLGDVAALVGGGLDARSPRPLSPAASRERRVEGFARLLEHAARDGPLLAVLDDVHRADRGSLAVLDRVSHGLASRPLVLLATFRPDELAPESPIRALARRPEAVPLVLDPLTHEALERLVRRELGPSVAARRLQRICTTSGGNPFFAKELARSTENPSRFARDPTAPLPPAIRQLLGETLAQLPEPVRRLLVHAALAGNRVDPGWMARALAWSLPDVIDALDVACQAGAVGRRGERWSFRHELVRHALLEDLPARELARAHRRLGETLLERARGAEERLRAARHLCQGAANGAAERAIALAVAEGEAALRRQAHEDAADLLEAARVVPETSSTPDPETELRLLLALGEAQVVTGERAAGREALRRAVGIARDLHDADALARAALAFGGVDLSPDVSDDPELVAFLEDVLRDLPPGQDALRVRILVRLGMAYGIAGRPIAEEVWTAGTEAARSAPDPAARAHALYGRRWTLVRTCDLATRLLEGDTMLALAREAGSAELELAARSCRFLDRLELGRVAEADTELEAYAALAEAVGVARYRYRTGVYRAARAMLGGRLEDAERLAAGALAEGLRFGARDALLAYACVLFTVRREQARFDEILAGTESTRDPIPSLPIVFGLRSAALLETGRRDELRARLPEAAAATLESEGPYFLRIAGFVMFGEAALALGLHDWTERLLAALEPFAGRVLVLGAGVAAWGALDRTLGRLAAGLGDLDRALAWLDAARALERRMGAGVWLGWTELARAELFEQRRGPGDAEAGAHARAEAGAVARELGLVRLERHVRGQGTTLPPPG